MAETASGDLDPGDLDLGDLDLVDVRPWGGPATRVAIRGGRIAAGAAPDPGVPVEHCGSAILLPGLVEAHTHIDKTHLGLPWRPHREGLTVPERAAAGREAKRALALDPARQATAQIRQTVALGTTTIRTHVDVDTEIGVSAVEGVLAAREAAAGLVDVQIVAFPQSGLLVRPGTAELLDVALRLGADVVGGLDPSAMDRDPKGHLDAVFALAERHAKPIDIHLHEPGELGAFAMDLIVERTVALGLAGQVTVSHAFCLGMPDGPRLRGLIEALARAGIAIMTIGACDRPSPSVKALVAGGVTVCSGSDGIRDAWSPYGNGDMLERATILGLANGFRRDEDLELALRACTFGGAAALGLEAYGLDVGCRADLVTVRAETLAEAVVARPERALVLKRGRVVSRDGMLA